jgi:hypothetical protein
VASLAFTSGRAHATTYTFDESASPSEEVCSTSSSGSGCYTVFIPPSGLVLKAGDVVNFDVTFTAGSYSVPPTTKLNDVYVALLDDVYFGGPGTAQMDSATSTVTLSGYNGPSTFDINNSDPNPIEYFAFENPVLNVPEPGTLTLIGLGLDGLDGLDGLGVARRWRLLS